MRSFYDLSIKWKLIGLLLVTSLAGLLLVTAGIGVYEFGRVRHSMVHELLMQAELTAAHGAPALVSGDGQAGQAALAALRIEPDITGAALFTAQGSLVAEYNRDNARAAGVKLRPSQEVASWVQEGCLVVSCPVRAGSQIIGSVSLSSDLQEERSRLRTFAGLGAVALLGALLVTLVLSLRLQRVVSRPLLNLNRVARAVAQGHDYSLRAVKESPDEIGDLVDSFNQMLAQIARDITRRKQLETEIIKVCEHERTRIGQDLHDSICQQLIRTAMAANQLELDLGGRALPEALAARKICALLDSAIVEARQLARGLYPVKLANDGLAAALADLAREASRDSVVACALECPETLSIHDHEAATHLFRIAQEAVNNSVKHSEAKQIQIKLEADAGLIHLKVTDDGIGLPAKWHAAQGMGLNIMSYRAQLLGGRFQIRRNPAGGTIAECSVPRGTVINHNGHKDDKRTAN